MEDLANRFLELLNYPLIHRCPELTLLIDRCSIKQLQDIFPTLIRSIFGDNQSTGWGIRTITPNTAPHEFQVLYNFFIPLGPMFRLCYRLLNDALKFEIPISCLPDKMRQMLESGRYPNFYSDIINFDPFRRQISSLSLNAFDYFMINFAIHGTIPLHKRYPAALTVQNERLKSLYLFLTADYLCLFLPSNPDSIVMPQICGSVKTTNMIPVQPVQPSRSPKYLSLSAISHHTLTNQANNTRVPDSPREHAWRTESVLYLFTDSWLRFDCDDAGDLPSNEFIRVVRILVKQIHAFGNSADLDGTSMSILRKLAQPMLHARMYPFLKKIISRWPLDSSFAVVLELWLSYIQPWRYTYDRNTSTTADIPIAQKFDHFIAENMVSYTQIFVQLLPRFQSLDLSTLRNVAMLFRLLKVFGQSNLSEIIRSNEFSISYLGVNASSLNESSPKRADMIRGMNISMNKTQGSGGGNNSDFTSFRENYFNDDTYDVMFGQSVTDQVGELIRKVQVSKIMAKEQIGMLESEIAERYHGLIKWFKYILMGADDNNLDVNLAERKKIPDILEMAAQTLARMYGLELSETSLLTPDIENLTANSTDNFNFDISADTNINDPYHISPVAMRHRARNIKYTGDPALIPIQTNECKFLVRFLHQLSCKLNLMFSHEMDICWHRDDFCGRITRQILSPPMTVQAFDKSCGFSRLQEQQLGPRISLRNLGAYRTFGVILSSFVIGYLFLGAPSYGFIILLFLTFFYLFFLSLINNVAI